MMSFIMLFIIVFSVVTAFFSGNISLLSTGIMQGAADGVQLIISICGNIILWSGLLNIADKCGITDFLAKIISPIICKFFFPKLKKDGEAIKNICMNISVNLLGLGNAATPLGLSAMENIEKEKGVSETACDEMILFVVMNTASMQLIPTTAAFLRMQNGSRAPMEILPCVIISSIVSLSVGIIMAKTISKLTSKKAYC